MSDYFIKKPDRIKTDSNYTSNKMNKNELNLEAFQCPLCAFILYVPWQLDCCGLRICDTCCQMNLNSSFRCPQCSEQKCQGYMDQGHKRYLDAQKISCPKCNDKILYSVADLKKHLLNSHRDLKCGNCAELFVLQQQLAKHQVDSCENRDVVCPLMSQGCSRKVKHRELAEHYCTDTHQKCIIQVIKLLCSKYTNAHKQTASQKLFDEERQKYLKELMTRIDSMVQEIIPMIDNCESLKLESQTIMTNINELVYAKLDTIKQLSETSVKLMENISTIMANIHKILEEIKSKSLTGPKLISLDSTVTIKIDILVSMNTKRSIQSETFQTSQCGYRIAIISDIFVDPQDHKSYLSISLVILEGEFDSILCWPMLYPATISIINLTSAQKHITHQISEKEQMTAFTRPARNGTSSLRIPKFCLIDSLLKDKNKYIQNDCIFIKTHIDFTASNV